MATSLATQTWGDGPRSILLLHGVSSNAAGWWRVGPDLAERGWTVSAPDLRGHGLSPKRDDYSLASYASDVLALDGPWDVVLGHSLGGAVAVTASRIDLGFASRLVLQDPALVMGLGSFDEVLGWLLESYERPATAEAVADANPNWGLDDCRIKAEALRQCPPEVVTATLEHNWPWDLIGPTAGIEVPTLVLGSDPDHGGIVPVTIGEWFAAEVPCVEYQMLAGAGHTAHREPSTYEAYLNAVLAAIGGGS